MNEMTKSETFTKPIRDRPETIITMNRQDHSKFRRALSHGFSDSAMRQQEPVIAKYIDLLISVSHQEPLNVISIQPKYQGELDITLLVM